MAEPVRARRLTDEEGQRLGRIVRRGRHESIRVRRATIILASSSGTPVRAIARLVAEIPIRGAMALIDTPSARRSQRI
jgi:hypothetical protein